MKSKVISILLLLTFTVLNTGLHAQSPRFTSYNILKNRKDVEVNSIFQDERGYIWLGTNYGLVKYDGVDFILFTEKDSLSDNVITSIYQDNRDKLWIGHKSGKITVYDGENFMKFSPEEGLGMKEISSFLVDNKDALWFSTFGEGVYYYSGENRKRLYNINSDDGLLDNFVYNIVQDAESRLYFATDKGISVYDLDNHDFSDHITTSDGLPDNIVKHLIVNNNDLWIAMEDGGICKYDILTRQFSLIYNWEFGSINNFILLSDSEVWVSTRSKGIIKIDYDEKENAWYTNYGSNNDIPDIRTLSIYKDRESNIWIGTLNGLSVRKNNNIEFLNEKDGFNSKDIFSFVIDDLGNYWVASQQGLYFVTRSKMGEIKEKLLFPDKNKTYSFISLFKDHSGNIWAGTFGHGVFIINPVTLETQNYNSERGLSNDNVIHISGDHNNVWLSTLGGGVTKCKVDNIEESMTFTTSDGLASDYVYSTFTDSKNRTWIATNGGGAGYILNDSIHSFFNTEQDTISPQTVYSVIEDNNNNIWFNCSDFGLYMYDGKELYNINEENGLKSNLVLGLTTDVMGNPVIISNEGFDKYITKSNLFEYHGEADGLEYPEPNLNSLYKDKRGNIWIGTANGILKLTADVNDTIDVLPKIFLTQKSIFFNPINSDQANFKYNENHLTFYYTALWYKSSESLTYRYKLDGYDLDWNTSTALRMVTYPYLPPGDYSFMVQVNYSGGEWMSSPDSEFSFNIRKPFWKTSWFILITVIIIIIGIYMYIKIRIKNLEHAKEILEEEVKNRTAEIQLQKEEIETQRIRVTVQRDKIELQNKHITSSINYAGRIQRAVIPSQEDFSLYLREHFIFFKPREIVSGDFYYLNTKGETIIVAAADCTGHGVPGAFMSILGISLLNQIINQEQEFFTAGDILNHLSKDLKTALRQTGKYDEAKDGMDIALCVLNRNDQVIHFAGAYNPLILVRNNELIEYKGDKMPIGIFVTDEKEMPFSNHIIETQKGDIAYLFSDGFQDQFGGNGVKRRKFFSGNFNKLLLEISGNPLQIQKEILEDTLNSWKGSEPQVDDIVIVGFKI